VIDVPRYPLEDDGGGVVKYLVLGSFAGLILISFIYLVSNSIKNFAIKS
jgi:hypothetical protein